MTMDRCEQPRWFLPLKYGQKLRPWEVFIRMKNNLSENNCSFRYKYSVKHESLNDEDRFDWEREPAK